MCTLRRQGWNTMKFIQDLALELKEDFKPPKLELVVLGGWRLDPIVMFRGWA